MVNPTTNWVVRLNRSNEVSRDQLGACGQWEEVEGRGSGGEVDGQVDGEGPDGTECR